jgi:hypothetical protein
MVLVILITNVLIRKREMMKVTQIENKHIKGKEPQRNFSRKTYAPKKTSHHQMKMKSVTVRHKELYSWQYKTLIKKTPKKNMKRPKNNMKRIKLTTKNNCCVP